MCVWVRNLSSDYLTNDSDLTEKDREKVQRQIKVMEKDMYLLYETFMNHNRVKHYERFKTLIKEFNLNVNQ